MPERDPDLPSREDSEAPDPQVTEETEAAAAEAAAIGGDAGESGVDPAERPLREAGQGESEGFEEAERELIENASHDESRGFPEQDIPEPEQPTDATFGEGDSASPPDGADTDAED